MYMAWDFRGGQLKDPVFQYVAVHCITLGITAYLRLYSGPGFIKGLLSVELAELLHLQLLLRGDVGLGDLALMGKTRHKEGVKQMCQRFKS